MSTTWKTAADFQLPPRPPQTSWVEWDLAEKVFNDIKSASLLFLAKEPDVDYANPGAYTKNLIAYADDLAANSASPAAKFLADAGFEYMPPDWDSFVAAIRWAGVCFAFLQQMPVNTGDPDTNNIYDAWVNHLGQYYGGHLPVAPSTKSTDTATGQSAAPPGTIL